MKIIMTSFNPAISNLIREFIRMARKFDEEIKRIEIMQLNELNMFPETKRLEELIESLKDNENFEYKNIDFPIPVKCIRATKVNRKKLKPIYYHVRSNC